MSAVGAVVWSLVGISFRLLSAETPNMSEIFLLKILLKIGRQQMCNTTFVLNAYYTLCFLFFRLAVRRKVSATYIHTMYVFHIHFCF